MYNGSRIIAQSVARVSLIGLRPLNYYLTDQLWQGTPLIYVNFNYRLGPLGYPQGQEGNLLGNYARAQNTADIL